MGIVRLRRLVEVNVAVPWDVGVSAGVVLKGWDCENCLAGLLGMFALMRPRYIFEESLVRSYETPLLQT